MAKIDENVKVVMLRGEKGAGVAELEKYLNARLADARYKPQAFQNSDAIKSAYPAGADGIFIAADTGHMWIYVGDKWTDAGVYQKAGVDKTLSIDGVPADAKVTGDAVKSLNETAKVFKTQNIHSDYVLSCSIYGYTDSIGLLWVRKKYTESAEGVTDGFSIFRYSDGTYSSEVATVVFKTSLSGTHEHVINIDDKHTIVIKINWDKVPEGTNLTTNNDALFANNVYVSEEYESKSFDIKTSIFDTYVKGIKIFTDSQRDFYVRQIRNSLLDTSTGKYRTQVAVTDDKTDYLFVESLDSPTKNSGIERLDLTDSNGVYHGYIVIDWGQFYAHYGYNNASVSLLDAKVNKSNIFVSYREVGYLNALKHDKPILTIIDDDGSSQFLQKTGAVCKELNVKCSLGIITSKIDTNGYLTVNDVKSLAANGYDILSHSYSHDPAVFKDSATDLRAVKDEAIENEYKKALDDLESWGINCETIVYPWGAFGAYKGQLKRYTELAKKYYQFGVTSGGGVMNDEVLNTWWLYRDFVLATNDIQHYQSEIDSIFNNNGWLILGTHSGIDGQFTNDFLKSIIQYAIGKGVDVMPFSEANEIKRNIASIGRYEEKSNRLYIGRNGVIRNN